MKFDVIIIGGGLAGVTAATALQKSGLRCAMIAEGLSLSEAPRDEFRQEGGSILAGDRVCSGRFDGNRLVSIRTEKLGDLDLSADSFVLASGKYFSCGIVADMDRLYEPVFGLDVKYDSDRSHWFNPSFGASQPFLDFGIECIDGCAVKDGVKIENLFPAGEVLAGISGARPGGSEQIIQSALAAADAVRRTR